MSEFGIKIKSLEAGSLYDVNRGVRDNIDMKNAMLVNSLFLDFLLSHGLSIWKNESTRDIISLSFSYGSRSYEEEVKHLKAQIDRVKRDQKISSDEREQKLNVYNNLLERADKQKDLYEKKSKEEIRVHYYVDGVTVNWKTHNRSGKVIKIEPIHYRMLYRTAGKAKKGSCMFIRDELYNEALGYLRMGIQLPEHNAPIVEIGVYSSLVTSSIVGKIKINPENILILKDVDSFFKTRVVSIETDENRHCIAKTIDDYSVKNTLFDGQALIDHAFFPAWADGYILLRHHFCKMAAFDCNLQEFFKDYYGEQYKTAKVKDMFGVEHYVKNIEVVTTNNAMKWLKFNVLYEEWCGKVRENDSMFGIVKTAHKSKLGDVQRQSYQMVNSLDLDSMEAISKCSTDYIMKLKSNDGVFLDYLKKNANFFNDFEVLTALVERNSDFVRSEYFRERKKTIIHNYVMNMKTGKLLQNGDNLVIIGSPYAMLLHAVGDDVEKDNTFSQEDGTIQCYTERFEDGEYLAGFRSPFNSRNNMVYLHNVISENIKKYFYIGRQCIAVNLQHTDLQARANGLTNRVG